MQPLLLLKQTIEATYDPGSLLIDGPNVHFTSASQLLAKSPRGVAGDTFKIDVETDNEYRIGLTFKKPNKGALEPVEMRLTKAGSPTISIRPGMKHEEIVQILPEDFRNFPAAFSPGKTAGGAQWRIGKNRGFLRFELSVGDQKIPVQLPGDLLLTSEHRLLLYHLRRIIHVPGLRGEPERAQKTTAVGTQFPGTFESYVASLLHYWQENEERKLRNVGEALEKLGLTWKVVPKRIDDTRVEIRVGRLTHRSKDVTADTVSIADVGFGVSQVLPVIVALEAAEKDQMVYIEQPELHLHPRAQSALAEVLTKAAGRGVRVVVETHSSLLLLGVQTLVAEGRFPAELVGLSWFSRDPKGVTHVESTGLDQAGRFGDWPEDFDEVDLKAEERFLNAVESSHVDDSE